MNQYQYLTQGRNPSQKRFFLKNLMKRYKLKIQDILCLFFITLAAAYYTYTMPVAIGAFLTIGALYVSIWNAAKTLPFFEKTIGIKIRWWHVIAAIIATTTVAGTVLHPEPGHALFLDSLEQFTIDLINDSSPGSGDTAIDEDAIGLVFNTIRVVFLLSVAAAALFAFNQAQQGNDWRPIIGQVGIAFAAVIAVDVITYFVIGGSA